MSALQVGHQEENLLVVQCISSPPLLPGSLAGSRARVLLASQGPLGSTGLRSNGHPRLSAFLVPRPSSKSLILWTLPQGSYWNIWNSFRLRGSGGLTKPCCLLFTCLVRVPRSMGPPKIQWKQAPTLFWDSEVSTSTCPGWIMGVGPAKNLGGVPHSSITIPQTHSLWISWLSDSCWIFQLLSKIQESALVFSQVLTCSLGSLQAVVWGPHKSSSIYSTVWLSKNQGILLVYHNLDDNI